ncbi:MAG: hypothetical protein ACM31G_07220 [Flavobacteriales bacterium]
MINIFEYYEIKKVTVILGLLIVIAIMTTLIIYDENKENEPKQHYKYTILVKEVYNFQSNIFEADKITDSLDCFVATRNDTIKVIFPKQNIKMIVVNNNSTPNNSTN